MAHQQIQSQNFPAQASSRAGLENSQKQTGYVCKSCGGVAPVGIGYAVQGWRGVADESRTSCDCGYSVKPVAEMPRLRVEASTSNPEERTGYERGNLHDYSIAESRKQARELARAYWHGGYWIEIYDDRSGELLAGPINPDAALPAYIV
ncbi:MAG: hypothetical protein JO200_08505 [Comamonas sp.]|nr:hypothetical protein [Comamonas sp.]